VFLLNSRLGLFSAASKLLWERVPSRFEALLLPKLRSQIAEFLNEGSLDHLGALTPAYQSRFAVRTLAIQLRGFSRQYRLSRVASGCPSASPFPQLNEPTDLPIDSRLRSGTHHVQWARSTYLPVSPRSFNKKRAVLEY
jgi:hypothetical protein